MMLEHSPAQLVSNVTAIIVTYRSRMIIEGALQSLINIHGVQQIIVVDNASQDGTCELVRQRFPQVTVIECDANLGYGRANNIGLELVTTLYALVLNPDVLIPAGGIRALVELSEANSNAAIVGPWPSFHGDFTRKVLIGRFNERLSVGYHPGITVPAGFLVGAAMFMRMELMREVGFFDPAIFLYYEDNDLCERVARAGHAMLLTSRALILHEGGRSSSPVPGLVEMKHRHFAWSGLYLEQKLYGKQQAMEVASVRVARYQRSLLLHRLTFNSDVVKQRARLMGIQDFLVGRLPPNDPSLCVSSHQLRAA